MNTYRSQKCRRPARARLSSGLAVVLALVAPAAAEATFPGKNGLIAFSHFPGASNSHAANFEIATIAPDSPLTPLLSQKPRKDNWPDWSPDGSQLVFWSDAGGTPANVDIYKMDADGSGQVNLTSENPGADLNAAWSPDGQEIVLDSNYQTPTGFSELQVMDAGGTVFRQLTHGGADLDAFGQFSPDGRRIAFCSNRGGHFAIYTLDADDGGNVQKLTDDSLEACLPDWSPDGERIVFADNFCATCPGSDIWIMDVNGTDLHRLTNTPFENQSFRPGFSPNGKKIVFTRAPILDLETFTTAPADIYVMSVKGTGLTNITNSPNHQDRAADWGPRPPTRAGDDA